MTTYTGWIYIDRKGIWWKNRYSAHLFVNTKDIHTSSPNPRRYTLKSDSGNSMERAWCDECGCGIWIKSDKMPDQTFLKAGGYSPNLSYLGCAFSRPF